MTGESPSFWAGFGRHLQDRLLRRALVVAALAATLMVVALVNYWLHAEPAGQTLNAIYGRRSGRGTDSVNGTAVLADMFELRGFRVRTVDRLSPRLEKEADVIVWFPDDFEPPTRKQRDFLERWLAGGSERTLVYVGRDYDAAADYWKTVRPGAPADVAKKMDELAASAEGNYLTTRGTMPKRQYARWFTAASDGKERTARQLSGPWSEGVVAAQAAIELRGRLELPVEADAKGDLSPPDETETLLAGDQQEPLAVRHRDFTWKDGQVIVVANGSFLLNYPLVNKEHRKLAERLIDECSGRMVAFLESGPGGPEVLDKEPPQSGGLAMLRIWPLNAIVVHLTILGIVVCLARWPIFGRPKELPAENAADFGRHVAALGQLLARTKNLSYAQSRLAQYQQQARRGSGTSHRK